MALRVSPLETGPFIGQTFPYGFRLWGRSPGRTAAGVARLRAGMGGEFGPATVFPLVPYYDDVGIVDFGSLSDEPSNGGDLRPQTAYSFEMGCVEGYSAAEVEQMLDGGSETLDWSELSGDDHRGSVRTSPVVEDATTRFVLGSCRDPESKAGEDTFEHIHEKLKEVDNWADFIIMTGDQIYIEREDEPLPREQAISLQFYWSVYRAAFARPCFAKVMRHLPAYMAMDDHEVQNNWTRGKFEFVRDSGRSNPKFHWESLGNGLRAYEAYQACLSSELVPAQENLVSARPFDRYWYKFRHGNTDVFMLDTRSESEVLTKRMTRKKKRTESKLPDGWPRMLGEEQFETLKAWFADGSGRTKFVVSSVPVFPDTRHLFGFGSPEDKWGGAVAQRHDLLEFIRELRRTQDNLRVVFLSGDVHVSYVAALKHKDETPVLAYNVVSSAFNWTPLGLQAFHFDFGRLKRKDMNGNRPSKRFFSERHYGDFPKDVYDASDDEAEYDRPPLVHHKNNFARITAAGQAVDVEFFRGANGKLLERIKLEF